MPGPSRRRHRVTGARRSCPRDPGNRLSVKEKKSRTTKNIREMQQHRCQRPMQVLKPSLVECDANRCDMAGCESSGSSTFSLDLTSGREIRGCPGGKGKKKVGAYRLRPTLKVRLSRTTICSLQVSNSPFEGSTTNFIPRFLERNSHHAVCLLPSEITVDI